MIELGSMSVVKVSFGPEIAVGARVRVPTNESGVGLDVVPDPDGEYAVVACEPGLIRVRRVDEPSRHARTARAPSAGPTVGRRRPSPPTCESTGWR